MHLLPQFWLPELNDMLQTFMALPEKAVEAFSLADWNRMLSLQDGLSMLCEDSFDLFYPEAHRHGIACRAVHHTPINSGSGPS